MASMAMRILVAAALLGNAAGAGVVTLPGQKAGRGGEADEAGSRAAGGDKGQNSLDLFAAAEAGAGPHGRERSEVSSGLGAEEGEQVDHAFNTFLEKHGRAYKHGTAEYAMRKALFKQRLAAVHAHNSKHSRRWKAGPSHFSDRTEAERKVVRGYKKRVHHHRHGASLLEMNRSSLRTPLPESMDWMHLAVATKIRDQGSCGSCWAIATVSCLEAHHEIYSSSTGAGRTFSAQQTLECTPNPDECGGQGGCEGATVELGMAYILANGIATEEEVPYQAQDHACSATGAAPPADPASSDPDSMQVLAKVAPAHQGGGEFGLMNFHTLAPNKDYDLAQAVANYGPVAVSASAGSWFEYNSGIFDSCEKDAVVDHAITLYGYGVEGTTKYWLIRNSWGADWGEHGFIRLLRHNDGQTHCGTDNDPAEGTGCKGGPASVEVCGMCGVMYDSVVPYFHGSPGNGGAAAPIPDPDDSLTQSAEVRHPNLVLEDQASARLNSNGEVLSIGADSHPVMMRAEARRH